MIKRTLVLITLALCLNLSAARAQESAGDCPKLEIVSASYFLDGNGGPRNALDNATTRLRALCAGREKCEFILGNDVIGFDPAEGFTKRLSVVYSCGPQLWKTSEVEFNRFTLSCRHPEGQQFHAGLAVKVVSATYTVPALAETNLNHDNATAAVGALCDTRTGCQFTVGNDTIGFDPAPGQTKVLVIDYHCSGTERVFHAHADEYTGVILDCAE